jgi:Lar family restriction alleviation protein
MEVCTPATPRAAATPQGVGMSKHKQAKESRMIDLQPCPFCGGEAINIGSLNVVACRDCIAKGHSCASEDEAAEKWNRRASPWLTMDLPPRDGQSCLISSVASDCVLMAMWRAGLWFTYDDNPEPVSDVTHWMPVPDPVQEVGE